MGEGYHVFAAVDVQADHRERCLARQQPDQVRGLSALLQGSAPRKSRLNRRTNRAQAAFTGFATSA